MISESQLRKIFEVAPFNTSVRMYDERNIRFISVLLGTKTSTYNIKEIYASNILHEDLKLQVKIDRAPPVSLYHGIICYQSRRSQSSGFPVRNIKVLW